MVAARSFSAHGEQMQQPRTEMRQRFYFAIGTKGAIMAFSVRALRAPFQTNTPDGEFSNVHSVR